MSKTILHIVNGLGRGGAEVILVRIINSWDKNLGDRHVIVSLRNNCVFDKNRIDADVHILEFKNPFSWVSELIKLKNIVNSRSVDVVYAWMYYSCIASLVAFFLRKPSVWTIHHSFHNFSNEPLKNKISIWLCSIISWLSYIKKIVYVSDVSRVHHEAFGFCDKKSVVISNGVNCEDFKPNVLSDKLNRSSLGIPEDAYVIGCFSRLDPIKNHKLLLKVYENVLQHNKDVYLLLAGEGVAKANTQFALLVSQFRFIRQPILLGDCESMVELYNIINIYALTSLSESFPNAVCEAMACGVPVVSTNVGAVPAIVGDSGWIVENFCPQMFAKVIINHSEMNSSDRQIYSEAARERIGSQFPMSKTVEKYMGLSVLD